MKSKFLSFILFIILIFLVIVIAIFGMAIYKELTVETEPSVYQVSDIFTEEPKDSVNKKEEIPTESISQKIQNAIKTTDKSNITPVYNEPSKTYFFYNQLNDNQKIIYNGLNESKDFLKQGDYVIKYGNVFTTLLQTETGSETLGNDYQAAIEAFLHDNIDLFYLDVNKMYLNIETTTKFFKTTYNVYISPSQNSNYLNDEFTSKTQIESAISAIENAKNNILAKLKGTDYQNILFLHDYLVDNIEYDSKYKAMGSYSIYGALIERKCVCEGYAKAFKYLANSAGIECELMQGNATNSANETENHAWNCVKINGTWYEVDATWDDPIVIGNNGRATNEMKYRYFLKGTNTFNKDHELEYQFSKNGKKFFYPTISLNDY